MLSRSSQYLVYVSPNSHKFIYSSQTFFLFFFAKKTLFVCFLELTFYYPESTISDRGSMTVEISRPHESVHPGMRLDGLYPF